MVGCTVKNGNAWDNEESNFTYEIESYTHYQGARITSYTGDVEWVEIPETIDGLVVSAIESNALKDTMITNLRLPNSMRTLPANSLNTGALTHLSFYGDYAGKDEVVLSAERFYETIDDPLCTLETDASEPEDYVGLTFDVGCPIHTVLDVSGVVEIGGEKYYSYTVVVDIAHYESPLLSNFSAYAFGFEGNDIILSIDGVDVDSWQTFIDLMLANTEGNLMNFIVERDGVEVAINDVWPYDHELLQALGASNVIESQIGVQSTTEFRFFASFGSGFNGLYESGTIIFRTLGLLATHDRVGIGDLAGPIGIYSLTSSAARQGLISLMSWTALLSVNLGVINLLPIPALDGGRLVILGYEGVTRKKLPKRVENTMHLVAFMLLMGLFIYVAFNDILRLFNIR